MFHEFLAGAKSYPRAWRLIWKARMWPFLIVPGLLATFYFPIVGVITWFFGREMAIYLRDHVLPQFMHNKIVVILFSFALLLLGLYVGFILFRNLVMILCSPVLSFLSRKTEEKALGTKQPSVEQGFLEGMLRAILMSILSIGLAVFFFCFCIVLLFIPIVGQVAMAVLLPASQMFLAGHGFVDPTLERHGYNVSKSFGFVKRHFWRVLGCGAMFVLLTMIPIVGWFLAPTLGVVAGTLLALDVFEKSSASKSAVS